jgi:hypothetical protein
MTLTFLSLLFLISLTNAELVFKVTGITDGSVDYDPKTKYQKLAKGEDAFVTSEHSLVVADGVGASQFISYYFASALSYSVTAFFLQLRVQKPDYRFSSNSQIANVFDRIVTNEIGVYEKQSAVEKNDPAKDRKWYPEPSQVAEASARQQRAQQALKKRTNVEQIELKTFQSKISATLIGAFLEQMPSSKSSPETAKAQLNIYQRGDSRLLVFRPTPSGKENSYVYMPVYKTVDIQETFNSPYQFDLSKEGLGYYDSKPKTNVQTSLADFLEVREHDLVVVGSDGLFDNVHLSFITYLVNFLVGKLSDKQMKIDELKTQLETLTQEFLGIFKRHYESLNKLPESQQQQTHSRTLDQQLGQREKHVPVQSIVESNLPTSEAKNDVRSFFRCSVKDIVSEQQFKFDKNAKRFGYHLSGIEKAPFTDCVIKAITQEFSHTKTDIKNYAALLKAQQMSSSILQVVKTISKQETNYPSPFFISYAHNDRKYSMPQVLRYSKATAKADDITIVTGLIVNRKTTFETSIKRAYSCLEEVLEARTKMYADYQEDVIHFYQTADIPQIKALNAEMKSVTEKSSRLLI